VCVRSVSIRHSELSLDVVPASPFIVFKERARVTFVVKKQNGKRLRVRPSSSLSGGSSFSCSAEMQQALIFWPLHPLVQHDVAMFRPVCFCAVEDGWYGRLDLCREGGRWYSCRYPRRCRGMDVVVE
jgi:hypothetical protein